MRNRIFILIVVCFLPFWHGCQSIGEYRPLPEPEIETGEFDYGVPAKLTRILPGGISLAIEQPCWFPLRESDTGGNLASIMIAVQDSQESIHSLWIEILDDEGRITETVSASDLGLMGISENDDDSDTTATQGKAQQEESDNGRLSRLSISSVLDTDPTPIENRQWTLRLVLRTNSGETTNHEFMIFRTVEAPYGTDIPELGNSRYLLRREFRRGASLYWRIPLYMVIGLARDVADAPFTLCYNNPEEMALAGYAVGYVVGSGLFIYSTIHGDGGYWEEYVQGVGLLFGGLLGGALAPAALIAVMPIETALFRYPADDKFFDYKHKVVGRRRARASNGTYHLSSYPLVYFPNLHYFLYASGDESRYREAVEKRNDQIGVIKRVVPSYRVWYSLGAPRAE